jgi:ubiquinone/menaquinone biosynthesis C-methylase UbiE
MTFSDTTMPRPEYLLELFLVTASMEDMTIGKQTHFQDVIRHYEQADEDSRLEAGWFRLEFARTKELILRHLPPVPSVVLDVGGGSGVYAGWLAALGYEVVLVDPVPKHIEQARKRSRSQERAIARIQLGNARKLDQGDDSVDCVLLLGPLYHLTESDERLICLKEAFRVLRAGAILFAAAISRYASLLDSLLHGFFDAADFASILENDLRNGQHRNPTGKLDYFTTAYFHRPQELVHELAAAGFKLEKLAAIEGPGWMAKDFDRLWTDTVQRERLLRYIRTLESEPELVGASPHLMAIARK